MLLSQGLCMQIDFFLRNNGLLRGTEHLQITEEEDKELNSKHLVPNPVLVFLNRVCYINVSVSLRCHSKIPQTGGNVNGNTEKEKLTQSSLWFIFGRCTF